jgi:hypothetical protein
MPKKPESENKKRSYKRAVVVLYMLNDEYVAAIAHPNKNVPDEVKKISKIGINTAVGMWMDRGYNFTGESTDIPDFAVEKIPKGATAIGVRAITGVPFPV